MTSNTMILKSIINQMTTVTDILYSIYEKKPMSEQALALTKSLHKRLCHFIETQEVKLRQRKTKKKA